MLGIVAAEFPDSDLVYSGPVLDMGPLGYLLHHRGHTHTIVWAVASALLLWWVARRWVGVSGGALGGGRLNNGSLNHGSLNHGSSDGGSSDGANNRGGLVSRALMVVALVGTLSHLLLDFTNSYGVHPFWPFDGRWYYGDAVFIVEPWLWLVAIPALFWNRPSSVGKVLLPLFYLLILAAVWFLGQVARDVAVVLFVFAAAWPLVLRMLGGVQRTAAGMLTWGLVTALFFVASSRAEATVRAAASRPAGVGAPQVLDVVLNPGPGDWGCWSALVMSRDGGRYRVTSAFVAPFGAVRSLEVCSARYQQGRIGGDVLANFAGRTDPVFAPTASVAWRSSWSAPLADLPMLARERCEVHAALHFMRTPVWQRVSPAQLLLSDARFGIGGSGFNEVVVPTNGGCSIPNGWIPGWVPPRTDLLDVSLRGDSADHGIGGTTAH
ncbi:hypothetical protein MASR1M101_20030 [Gemmatimonas sp.]